MQVVSAFMYLFLVMLTARFVLKFVTCTRRFVRCHFSLCGKALWASGSAKLSYLFQGIGALGSSLCLEREPNSRYCSALRKFGGNSSSSITVGATFAAVFLS